MRGAISLCGAALLAPVLLAGADESRFPSVELRGGQFVDPAGRTMHFRGINVSGSSKVPAELRMASHVRASFFDHRDVSFVGRPFPLEEADEHLGRIASWGFNLIRLVVT